MPPGYIALEDGTILGKSQAPLKLQMGSKGYLHFKATIDGRVHTLPVHVAVCEAFHGPRPFPEAQVRHLDGNPLNNSASNLKWGTAKENAADRKLHGTENHGERNGHAKLTERDVQEIRKRYAAGGVLQRDLATEHGIAQCTVSEIIRRQIWTHI